MQDVAQAEQTVGQTFEEVVAERDALKHRVHSLEGAFRVVTDVVSTALTDA